MQYLVINEKLPATNSTKINKNKIHSKKNQQQTILDKFYVYNHKKV